MNITEKYKELKKIILNSNRILITTHMIPDGDAIGSEFAMYHYLKKTGKEIHIINHSPTPENLAFLDVRKKITRFLDDEENCRKIIGEADLVFLLDTNDFARTKSMESVLRDSKAVKVCIDHHLDTNEKEFDLLVSDVNLPATAELLYDYLIFDSSDSIDKTIASNLYAGIMTDTGSFRYPRTTEKTFLICADLVRRGADPVMIFDLIYGNSSKDKVRLLARFIDSLSFHYDDKVVIGTVTEKDFRDFNLDVEDVDGFSTFIMSIKNIRAGFVIVELPKNIKLSFRSKGNIKINEFARQFGGGGHKNASGAYVEKTDLKSLKQKLIDNVKQYLN